MKLRFQKRVKIAPGVRINLSRSGISTTVGAKGASVNIGKKGAYANLGLPGTGLSTRTKIGVKSTVLPDEQPAAFIDTPRKPSRWIWPLRILLGLIVVGIIRSYF